LRLVKCCALGVADVGITVNAVCLAAVNTDMFFNQPTYKLFCPDIDNPTIEDFEERLKGSSTASTGVPTSSPSMSPVPFFTS
jgi:hypothetical protein